MSIDSQEAAIWYSWAIFFYKFLNHFSFIAILNLNL